MSCSLQYPLCCGYESAVKTRVDRMPQPERGDRPAGEMEGVEKHDVGFARVRLKVLADYHGFRAIFRIGYKTGLAAEVFSRRRLIDIADFAVRPRSTHHLREEFGAGLTPIRNVEHPEIAIGAPRQSRIDGREVGRELIFYRTGREFPGRKVDDVADGAGTRHAGKKLRQRLVLIVDRRIQQQQIRDEVSRVLETVDHMQHVSAAG